MASMVKHKHTHAFTLVAPNTWKCGVCKKVFARARVILEFCYCMNCGRETIATIHTITSGNIYCLQCMPFKSELRRKRAEVFFESLKAAVRETNLFAIEKIRQEKQKQEDRKKREELNAYNKEMRKIQKQKEKDERAARRELKESVKIEIPTAVITGIVFNAVPPEPTKESLDNEGFFDA